MKIRSIACAAVLGGVLAGLGSAEAMPVGASSAGFAPALVGKAAIVVVKRRPAVVVRRPRVVKKVIIR